MSFDGTGVSFSALGGGKAGSCIQIQGIRQLYSSAAEIGTTSMNALDSLMSMQRMPCVLDEADKENAAIWFLSSYRPNIRSFILVSVGWNSGGTWALPS